MRNASPVVGSALGADRLVFASARCGQLRLLNLTCFDGCCSCPKQVDSNHNDASKPVSAADSPAGGASVSSDTGACAVKALTLFQRPLQSNCCVQDVQFNYDVILIPPNPR